MQRYCFFLELQNKLRRKCKKELYYKNIGVKQLKSSEWNYIKVRSGNIKKLGIKLQKSPEKFLLTDIHFVLEFSGNYYCRSQKVRKERIQNKSPTLHEQVTILDPQISQLNNNLLYIWLKMPVYKR